MLIQKQRLATQAKLKTLQRRPPNTFLSVLNSREEAERLKSHIESRSLFQELLTRGIIRKVNLRGLIPQDKYLNYRLKEAIAFINRYNLESQPEWSRVFDNEQTEAYVDQLARNWRVPKEELRRLLRLLSAKSNERGYKPGAPLADHELVAADGVLDVGDRVEKIADFVSRYELSQQDFVNYILSGSYDSRELSSRFGCDITEAEDTLKLVSHLEFIEAFREDSAVESFGLRVARAPEENVLAEVRIASGVRLEVRFLDNQKSGLYLVNYRDLEHLEAPDQAVQIRSLIEAIQALNERSGTLANIVQTISSIQRDFIASGDFLDLRPLSQAEVALYVGCHRSVVSRLIRGEKVLISNRTLLLSELMPRTKDVIGRLLEATPYRTDSQIAKHLLQKFNIRITPRAVNHHRNALAKETKR
ncbi:MAG TPA: hypothetical protein VJM50_07255 [Pyrinomonadaceae bacterium]|nr:hypothetical protein [Pyrinomonadaceae bacterium]